MYLHFLFLVLLFIVVEPSPSGGMVASNQTNKKLPSFLPAAMIHRFIQTPNPNDLSVGNAHLRRELLRDVFLDCQLEPAFTQYLVSELGDSANSQSDLFGVAVIGKGPDGNRGLIPIDLTLLSVFLTMSRIDTGEISFENQSFGRDGGYTQEIKRQAELLYDFWQLGTSNIGDRQVRLVALHSEDLEGGIVPSEFNSEGNIGRAINFFLEYSVRLGTILSYDSTASATIKARNVIEEDLPKDYSNGALTLTAFILAPTILEGPYAQDFILGVGDAILDFYEGLGNAEVGVDFLMAHEMAHVVQFSLDTEEANGDFDAVVQHVIKNPLGPEEELEADAMATYSLILAQNYTVDSLVKVVEAAAAIGDRLPEIPTHHGTPEQRSCAVRWAADEVLSVGKMSPREFRTLFQANLDRILQLDVSVCAFVGTPEELERVACGESSSIRSEVLTSIFFVLFSTISLFL